MQIKVAAFTDAEAIYAIEKACFSVPWSLAAIKSDLENEVTYYVLALEDEKVIGYGGLWNVVDEGQITNIAVHPEKQKKGVGKAIVEALIEYGKTHELDSLILEVRASNEAAQRLYESTGFSQLGKRKSYYKKPTEDALMMQLQL